jgi:hypothetical protein
VGVTVVGAVVVDGLPCARGAEKLPARYR